MMELVAPTGSIVIITSWIIRAPVTPEWRHSGTGLPRLSSKMAVKQILLCIIIIVVVKLQ